MRFNASCVVDPAVFKLLARAGALAKAEQRTRR
jgi:hypothetical protein